MRKHLEDNDSSAVAAVLDQLHEALGDVLDDTTMKALEVSRVKSGGAQECFKVVNIALLIPALKWCPQQRSTKPRQQLKLR